MSVPCSAVSFTRLCVATLECCRLSWKNLMWVVLSVACACVGVGIPVDSHISSLCFV